MGKTAIAEGLAQRIVSGDVPETLKGRKLMSLDMGALIAGKSLESWEVMNTSVHHLKGLTLLLLKC